MFNRKDWQKQYNQTHREQINEYFRKYWKEHPDKYERLKKQVRENNRKFLHKNPEIIHQRQKENRDNLRRNAFDILGNKCVRCGFSDIRALQIDHVNGGGVKENRTIGTTGICKNVIAGSKDYQLLCANCNWIKKTENGEIAKNRGKRTTKT